MTPRNSDPIETVIGALREAGSRPRPSGNGYAALCPAHPDRNPSLSVNAGEDGRALVSCFAGCSLDEILAALHVRKSELFVRRGRTARKPSPRRHYVYEDQGGTPAFRVVREHPKRFWQERYDPKTGKWCRGMDGVVRVPYRLPQLLSAVNQRKPIYVVEGEKDVEAIEQAGGAATCNPGGAGKWKDGYSEHMRGCTAVVVADRDESGYRHAAKVAQSLQRAGCDVTVVEPRAGKDAADHLGMGFPLDDFVPVSAADAAPPDDRLPARPRIAVNGRDPKLVVEDAVCAVAAANDPPTVFRHGDTLCRIVGAAHAQLELMDQPRARKLLVDAAEWVRTSEKGDRYVWPPRELLEHLQLAEEWDVPLLRRLVAVPTFTSGGQLLIDPGFHSESGLYLATHGAAVVAPSSNPSAAEVESALEVLLGACLGDFPFVSHADQAHALALCLQPFVRELISGPTPLYLIESPSPGTGKGLMVKTLNQISAGRSPAMRSLPKNEEEFRKALTSALLGAPASIVLDNASERVDSPALATALTADEWSDRYLGHSRNVTLPVSCTWVMTGNNVTLSTELARRTVRIRLDAAEEQPWRREEFRHSDLLGWVGDNRGRLVTAALTIVQAWISAGQPEGKAAFGEYGAWSRVVGGILHVARVEGFLGNLDEFYAHGDDEAAESHSLISRWHAEFGDREVGVAELWPLAQAVGLRFRSANARGQRTEFGHFLGRLRDRVVGEHQICQVRSRQGAAQYRLRDVHAAGG